MLPSFQCRNNDFCCYLLIFFTLFLFPRTRRKDEKLMGRKKVGRFNVLDLVSKHKHFDKNDIHINSFRHKICVEAEYFFFHVLAKKFLAHNER